ncbi:glycosyltransferase [Methylobacterium nodulans]|uniref:Glycosyltransferase 28 domain protein n=1 Tax=Methylobacterium nodulans (strain LMG 21967 / CNCM I-2342 / ORS 2060) TaxID=460265 RepID=B8IKH9_METNO|nr:glycosyltransferase [Methylobacterium nodulans]ACL61964.1 Glycosyltransferase 28 domain protein [Methylobacterium nodulans ORS 2060]
MSRILIAVTHLLGAGHLTRAAALARAFAGAGHAVTLVSGGMPAALPRLDGIRLRQLPPVRIAGTAFTALLDPDGAPVGPDHLAARRAALLAALAEAEADAVITELFPFGRRVLAEEFEALVAAARAAAPRPLLLASVRDVLARPSRPDRIAATHARLSAYDAVLVHADPALLPLDASWPVDGAIRPLLRYTGYVDEAPAAVLPVPEIRAGIVVSGGSSAAGLPLQQAALGAARLVPEVSWRVLVGRAVPEADLAALRETAPGNVTVERARPDFRALLAGAALSVSQAGYNTVLDLLRSGCPALLVPFEAGHETEQRLRAETLAARGLARVLPEAELTAERLAEAVAALLAAPAGAPGLDRPPVALDGAARSVAIVEAMLAERTAALPSILPALDWSPLDEALARLAGAGRTLTLWWRDDDACAHTPALDRLLALSRRTGVPVALAAIPGRAAPSLAARLAAEDEIDCLVHGLIHENHAPAGKKAELGPHRPPALLEDEARRALALARARFGRPPLPVLVPPWNRIAPELPPALPGLGYRGFSAFGLRGPALPGLIQVNTHIDPVAWHAPGRGLVDPAVLLPRAAETIGQAAERDEPVGLLTHHLVQDAATWAFCAALLERLTRHPIVGIARAAALFAPKASPVSQTHVRVAGTPRDPPSAEDDPKGRKAPG